ncbi:hypothetical protein [Fluviicola taffensis]|uniref:hypothetical protein n=1 Tax=Fluviicola taffensis TaxID=191579 RepID=UPI0031382FAF
MKVLIALIVPISFLFSCQSDIDPGEIYALEVLQGNTNQQFGYGEEKLSDIREMSEDRSNGEVQIVYMDLYRFLIKIDSLSGNYVSIIEKMKMDMFTSFHEELSFAKEESIIQYDYKKEKSSRPVNYVLSNVKSRGGSDILNPKNRDLLITSIRRFRRELCEIIEKSACIDDRLYFFKDPTINDFKDKKDFDRQFDEKTKESNIAPDDIEAVRKIYFLLSKTDKQWESILTEEDSWVDVMGVLLSVENSILEARLLAFYQMRGRVGCGGSYSFSKILPLVNVPNAAVAGDTVQLEVLMAAFNEYKTPDITVSGGRVGKIKDGKGYISIVVPNSKELEVKGTITINNKSGIPTTNEWSHKIKVIPTK